jgi:hypothetical protein
MLNALARRQMRTCEVTFREALASRDVIFPRPGRTSR